MHAARAFVVLEIDFGPLRSLAHEPQLTQPRSLHDSYRHRRRSRSRRSGRGRPIRISIGRASIPLQALAKSHERRFNQGISHPKHAATMSSSYRREEYAMQQQGGRIRDPTAELVPILAKVRSIGLKESFGGWAGTGVYVCGTGFYVPPAVFVTRIDQPTDRPNRTCPLPSPCQSIHRAPSTWRSGTTWSRLCGSPGSSAWPSSGASSCPPTACSASTGSCAGSTTSSELVRACVLSFVCCLAPID